MELMELMEVLRMLIGEPGNAEKKMPDDFTEYINQIESEYVYPKFGVESSLEDSEVS